MRCVFKYPFSIKSTKFELLLPIGWKFLTVMVQDERPHLYAEVPEGTAKQEVSFAVYGTSHEIPDGATWIHSYDIGPFVFHLYRL